MRRLPIPTAVVAGALALAACGSDGGDSGDASSPAPADGSPAVSVERVDGIGDVLVDDATGLALYAADEEANGDVLCVDACEAFWSPLEAGDGTPTTQPGVGELGVTTRPDGTRQVTADGRPLYTFTEDSPGEVTGDGFSDDFGGQHFTWHVVVAGGATTDSPDGESTGDSTGTDGGFDY